MADALHTGRVEPALPAVGPGASTALDELVAQGFAVRPLLGPAAVARALALAPAPRAGSAAMAFSDHALAGAERLALTEAVRGLLGAELAELVPGHRIISASFVVKAPGPDGAMGWHVDPAVTDERRWRSLSAWIPLVDVDGRHGALEVLAGGHRGCPPARGGRGALVATHPPHAEVLAACRAAGGWPSGPLVARAGDVVLYDHRLPHRSGASVGPGPRPALNVGLLPGDAPLVVHDWIDDERCEAWVVPDASFGSSPLDRPPASWPGARSAGLVAGPPLGGIR